MFRWWYALLLIEVDDKEPRQQIVMSWTTFPTDGYSMDGRQVRPRGRSALADVEENAYGLTLSWRHDGAGLQYPLVSYRSPIIVEDIGNGVTRVASSASGSESSLLFGEKLLSIRIRSAGIELFVDGSLGTDTSALSSSDSKLMYAQRVRRLRFQGHTSSKGASRPVAGIAYFQHVILKKAMVPWQWTYAVFADGSVAAASAIYWGPNSLKRSNSLWHPFAENLKLLHVSRGYFIDGSSLRLRRFPSSSIRLRSPLKGSVPLAATVTLNGDDGIWLEWDFEASDRLGFALTGPGPFRHFYYNSFFGKIERVRSNFLSDVERLGSGSCNLEHTFGLLS